MIQEYCQNAIVRAAYKNLDDGTWFAEIPGFQGVWGNGESIEACREDLLSVLEEWLVIKNQDKDPLPCQGTLKVRIPNPHKSNEISDALLSEILRQAGISKNDILT